ncbi:aspartate--ammonia ligase [[Clostridium] methylpentosum DSM 5476]|uniref:Aspartate--ammonia ligase n=1 Tax=[Clostridium] methylpentosum DSM 5476 TaxID=537013 RepID=C0EAH1_9FIRM|nr:aspartate--ammonia ligase [[Clostridium] methylpentosum DSM 5476]MDY3988273.1 aspartate--ammonia ligase [Massilioclostridium sp.]MEE1492174.1 aspartate--ammonia ligase [Massilioclostridium sp.]
MSKVFIPKDYQSPLGLYDTQSAIELVKRTFEEKLTKALNLKRVTAPLFVDSATGVNDNLNGVERPVSFDILETKTDAQVVHSLAKWKRLALYKYGFKPGEGLYTNMNAIRRDEELTNLHSIYVDQWDWEKIITREMRNLTYLKETVTSIVGAICDTLDKVKSVYPDIPVTLSREVSFVTTQQLEDLYPSLSPKERENEYLKVHKTAFIMQIGDLLKSGEKHDGRAPDYDDWKLNGDIVFWNELLGRAFEVSSMGIRVDAKSLDEQLTKADCDDRRELPFHKMVLDGTLPLTMGGGIGQSRICMLLLGKAHIGEVQVSIWDSRTLETCEAAGVNLL